MRQPTTTTPHLMLLTLALLLPFTPSTLALRPIPRTYSTHHYYSLETRPGVTESQARDWARELGVEWVEKVGELDGVWLVRDERPRVDKRSDEEANRTDHPVLARWDEMRKDGGIRKRTEGSSTTTTATIHTSQIKRIDHLPLRKRTKRSTSSSSPPPFHPLHLTQLNPTSSSFSSRQESNPNPYPTPNLTELNYAQTQLNLQDPLLPDQWHIINTLLPDVELNVTKVWGEGVRGKGVKVAIIDDGLDMDSEDLEGNFYAEGSYDFNDHDPLPRPRLSDDQHGTRCAGEIAAIPNDVCGVGVAYESKISGIRILSAPISDADEAAALNYEYQKNDVYSCSWGPPDDGRSMDAPEGLILKAMVNGVQRGRGGKGSVFVFAAGNGGGLDDQCNFDGYTNSIFSLTIGAVDRKGLHPYYSEMCAAMLVVAPSSGSGDHIHTTDVGKRACTSTHGGTSAAAPLAGGVVALALQVNPDLSWRDVQHVLINSAIHFNPTDPDWEKTASGRLFSYKYGYGRLDAGKVVDLARRWESVKPQAWFDSPAVFLGERERKEVQKEQGAGEDRANERRQDEVEVEDEAGEGGNAGEDDSETTPTQTTDENDPIAVDEPPFQAGILIPENGIESSYEITQDMLDDLNFEKLEHVTVRVWIDHQRRGDVEVDITSPAGINSVLARQRRFDEDQNGLQGWKFMSMKHWGEDPVGIWKIRVKDMVNPDKVGYFKSWSLQLWGEVQDPALARDWSPAESDASDEEQNGSEPTGTNGGVSQKPKPTALLPGDHGTAEGEAHEPGLGGARPTEAPDVSVGPGSGSGSEEIVNEDGSIDYTSDSEGWYHSGVNTVKENKTWFAGGGGIVILVIAATGLFFLIRSQRKRKMMEDLSVERGQYAPVAEEVPMGILGSRKRRPEPASRDLYEAFADDGLTDDEDDDEGDDRRGETDRLKYHDDFLADGDEDERPSAGGDYRDVPREKSPSHEQGSSSTSSWQDADPRARSPSGLS